MDIFSNLQIREMKKEEEGQVYVVFTSFCSFIRESTFKMLLFRKKSFVIFSCISILVYLAISVEASVTFRSTLSLAIGVILLVSLYIYEAFTYITYVRTKVAPEMSRDLFAHWSSDRRIMLVALHSEKVIGTVGIDYTSDPNTCEIKRMVVLPEYQGRGIGKKLLCTAEQTAISLGYRRVFLVTGNFQPRAIKFYNHMQYHPLPVLDESLGFLSATRKLHPFEKIL